MVYKANIFSLCLNLFSSKITWWLILKSHLHWYCSLYRFLQKVSVLKPWSLPVGTIDRSLMGFYELESGWRNWSWGMCLWGVCLSFLGPFSVSAFCILYKVSSFDLTPFHYDGLPHYWSETTEVYNWGIKPLKLWSKTNHSSLTWLIRCFVPVIENWLTQKFGINEVTSTVIASDVKCSETFEVVLWEQSGNA